MIKISRRGMKRCEERSFSLKTPVGTTFFYSSFPKRFTITKR